MTPPSRPLTSSRAGLTDICAEVEAGGEDRSARTIAAVIGRMISAGAMTDGMRLPTVRELARQLGVSPTTVSDAWQHLAAVGAIEAKGRNGTYVRRRVGPGRPRRYRQVTEGPGHFELDLSTGTPDPALLPDLGPIVAKVSRQTLTSSYLDHPVLPELGELLAASWPFEAEAITVVDGALDAMDRVSQHVLRLGDRVAVEHPAFPPVLDLLDQLGCEIVGVDVDAAGMTPEGLAAALAYEPRALFVQPRAHNPTGAALTEARIAELAGLLEGTDLIVIEDDHANEISTAPLVTFGRRFPTRTVHIRSFSKSHGPDLRLAAIGGAGDIVSGVANRRLLGAGWSSRILQALLVELLGDPATAETLAWARDSYASRREKLAAVLAERGIDFAQGDGINLWMRVNDERSAIVRLVTQGIGIAPGRPFQVRDDHDHLRVTLSAIGIDAAAHIGEVLAEAAGRRPHTAGR